MFTPRLLTSVKDIPSAKKLLKNYGIEYLSIGKKKDSLFGKGLNQIGYNYTILKYVLKYNIKLGIGSSLTLSHISSISPMKSLVFDDDDDEVEPFFVKYGPLFAIICFHQMFLKIKEKKRVQFIILDTKN